MANVFVSKDPLSAFPATKSRIAFRNTTLSLSTNKWIPLLSVRLNPNNESSKIILKDVCTAPNIGFVLIRNDPSSSVVQGTDQANWQNYNPEGQTQYDISRDATNAITLNQSDIFYAIASGEEIIRTLNFEVVLEKNPAGLPFEIILAGKGIISTTDGKGELSFGEVQNG